MSERAERNHERLCEYLVSMLAQWDGAPDDFRKSLQKVLNVGEVRIGEYIRDLKREGRLVENYIINHFKTRLCHEFRLGLKLDFHRMQQADPQRKPGAEGFIDRLIQDARNTPEIAKHLAIIEGIILHGVDRDVELTILTNNGIAGIYAYIRDELTMKYPFITGISTATVSYSHSRRAYAGAYEYEEETT